MPNNKEEKWPAPSPPQSL